MRMRNEFSSVFIVHAGRNFDDQPNFRILDVEIGSSVDLHSQLLHELHASKGTLFNNVAVVLEIADRLGVDIHRLSKAIEDHN